MKATQAQTEFLHRKLPIDQDEIIIGVYRHHPIAYTMPLLLGVLMVVFLSAIAYAMTSTALFGSEPIISSAYRQYVLLTVAAASVIILLFAYIPAWIKMQDQLVLTDESLLQILQTSLFSDKISQLSLQHVADVTVRAGFWGNVFGYGHLTVETPGEQDNYEYSFLPNAGTVAREISEAHENFVAALESGRMHTDFRSTDLNATRVQTIQQNQAAPIVVDPVEYQKFLDYQKQQSQHSNDQNPQ